MSPRHNRTLGVPTFGSYCKQAILSGCFLYSGAAVDVIFLQDTARELVRWVARMVEEAVRHNLGRSAEKQVRRECSR